MVQDLLDIQYPCTQPSVALKIKKKSDSLPTLPLDGQAVWLWNHIGRKDICSLQNVFLQL